MDLHSLITTKSKELKSVSEIVDLNWKEFNYIGYNLKNLASNSISQMRLLTWNIQKELFSSMSAIAKIKT